MRMPRPFSRPMLAACLLLAAMVARPVLAAAASPAGDMSPVGVWKQIDDKTGAAKSLIEIREVNGKLVGKVLKVLKSDQGPNPICKKCSGALKNQPVTGMEILKNMKPDGNSWSGGTILDPKSGSTYRCTMRVIDGGQKLKVRGYIGFSLFGRTQVWLREASQPAPASSGSTAPPA